MTWKEIEGNSCLSRKRDGLCRQASDEAALERDRLHVDKDMESGSDPAVRDHRGVNEARKRR